VTLTTVPTRKAAMDHKVLLASALPFHPLETNTSSL